MTFLTHGALPSAETVACAKSEFNIAQSRPRDNDSDDDDKKGDDNKDFEGFIINIIIQKQPVFKALSNRECQEKKVLKRGWYIVRVPIVNSILLNPTLVI